jgi:hypothetical protein
MKKIKKIAEGAYFVPSYSIPNVQSHIPGTMNYGIVSSGTSEEDAIIPEDTDVLTQEGFEEILKRVSRPDEVRRVAGKNRT